MNNDRVVIWCPDCNKAWGRFSVRADIDLMYEYGEDECQCGSKLTKKPLSETPVELQCEIYINDMASKLEGENYHRLVHLPEELWDNLKDLVPEHKIELVKRIETIISKLLY